MMKPSQACHSKHPLLRAALVSSRPLYFYLSIRAQSLVFRCSLETTLLDDMLSFFARTRGPLSVLTPCFSRSSCGILLPRDLEIEVSPVCVRPDTCVSIVESPVSPQSKRFWTAIAGLIVLANHRGVFEGVLGRDYCRFVAVVTVSSASLKFHRRYAVSRFAFRAPSALSPVHRPQTIRTGSVCVSSCQRC